MNPKTLLFKICISIVLFGYLVYKITLDNIYEAILKTNYYLLAITIPLIILLYFIKAIKWKILLHSVGIDINAPRSMKIVLMGTFYGMLTPGKIGELTRSYFLTEKKSFTLPTVIWDKLIDVMILSIFSIISLSLFFDSKLLYIFAGIFITTITFLVILCDGRAIQKFTKRLNLPEEFHSQFSTSMKRISSKKHSLLKTIILTTLYYTICFIIGLLTIISIDPLLNLKLVLGLPIIILLGNIPLTLSGIGTREFVATVITNSLHISNEIGFLFAFLMFIIITLVPGIIGFIINLALDEKIIKLKNVPGNYYNKHTSKNPIVTWLNNELKQTINRMVQKANAKSLLEVGCAEGYTTKYLAERNDLKILATDFEQSMVDKARSLHPLLRFDIADACDLKYNKNSFDVVLAGEVLEHLKTPKKALTELKRVAKRYCIISVPNEPWWCMANLLRLRYITDFGNTPGHIQNWTKMQFKELLEEHFEEVKIKTCCGLWNVALCKVNK